MTILTFVGLLLGITGIGIVFYENAFQHHPDGFIFGVALSVIAMLSWSVGTIIIVRNKTTLNPYYATGWQMLIGAFILFILQKLRSLQFHLQIFLQQHGVLLLTW